jgi:hypothetical protein
MKKPFLFMMVALLCTSIKLWASPFSVNISTGTGGVGAVDPLWKAMPAGGNFDQCSGVATGNPWSSSCSGGLWTRLPNDLPTMTIVYRMEFWVSQSIVNGGQLVFNTIAADDGVSAIRMNNTTLSFTPTSSATGIVINLPQNSISPGMNSIEVDVTNLTLFVGQITPCGLLICGKINYDANPFTITAASCSDMLTLDFSGEAGISSVPTFSWDFGDGTRSTPLSKQERTMCLLR